MIVRSGAGLTEIAASLHGAGIIESPLVFRIGVRVEGVSSRLKAGEYAFPEGASAREVAGVLVLGETVLRRVTFAEGLTSREIVTQLMGVEGLDGLVTRDVTEGSLLPETYYFSYGDTRDEIVRRMKQSMDEALIELWAARSEGLPISDPQQALVLASIVEKETGVPDERPRVAAVFMNRLRKGMRLQSDPTVVYGITLGAEPLGRALTRSDLREETPYNTYRIDGLPPGPIANPGRASIEAVLHPLETDELYFVASGDGGHAFSRTLDEHNRNVRKWRELQKQRAQDTP